MKKSLLNIILSIIICITFVTPVFAQNSYLTNSEQITKTSVETSKVMAKQPRGNVISTGILEVSNPGGGEIGVYMQTLTHVDVDETTFGIYLDRWIESEQRWATVADYKFTYNKENSPNEDLMTKAVSFNVVGQPADCYYRLRGVHLVILNGDREMLTTKTDGVLITK